jgi:ribosomal protein S18 acetylase RimI-like enzyme
MSPATIVIRSEGSPGLDSFLEAQIYEYNSRATGFSDGAALVGEVRDATGSLIGAVSGHTWGGSCEVLWLWVQESSRRQGLGEALLSAAETEARRRGCTRVVLATHSFQAPAFYERLGYVKVGEVADYPRGYAKLFYVKELRPSA